jgi:hypothetical protein
VLFASLDPSKIIGVEISFFRKLLQAPVPTVPLLAYGRTEHDTIIR